MRLFRRPRHPLEVIADHAANVIRSQLVRLNLCYRARRGAHEVEAIQAVEFVEPLIASPNEIKLEVDVQRLPRGVTIADLRQAQVLETLTAAIKYPVRAEHKKGRGGGFWFVVELEDPAAIPRLVRLSEIPIGRDAPALALPLGVGQRRQVQVENLRALPHLLIAGATQQGKSVLVNVLLCSIARRLGPERLQLYLADLKGGMELSFYEELPHLRRFVTAAADLPAMLADLQDELERRTSLMRGVARDIDGYNYQVPRAKALPYIVVVIDEIANAMLSRTRTKLADGRSGTIGQLSVEILADLAARSRAAGIHLVISTQRPSVDVVTGLIKANFPCRIAFGTASDIDSRVIIDDAAAQGLPRGRMMFRRNMELLELQAPFLSDDDVRRQVRAIVAGEPAEQTPEEGRADRERRELAELLAAAEASFARQFPIRELAKHTGIARDRVEAHAQRLEREQILRRRFGPFPRVLAVPMERWEAEYPPSVLRPASGAEPAQGVPCEPDIHTDTPTDEEAPAAPAAPRARRQPKAAPAETPAPAPRRSSGRRRAPADDQALAAPLGETPAARRPRRRRAAEPEQPPAEDAGRVIPFPGGVP